jgi:undecaprenyl phosphate N,N'-diacetylbacillosamine 1-phosphate transferase
MNDLKKGLSLSIKRSADILVSAAGLVIMSPIFVVVSIIIKITSPGPIFFLQRRVGRSGVVFKIIKFRTMTVDREVERRVEEHKVDHANDEQRMTNIGRILRRLKIDEMPQLLNVIKGDMSLVGPRPTLERQVARYTDRQRRRHEMRPGMTGLAQVNGGTALSWDERIEYDIDYVNNFSLWLDIMILVKTLLIIFFGEERFKKRYRGFERDQI